MLWIVRMRWFDEVRRHFRGLAARAGGPRRRRLDGGGRDQDVPPTRTPPRRAAPLRARAIGARGRVKGEPRLALLN